MKQIRNTLSVSGRHAQKKNYGQGLTEYIIIVALVAIASIVAVSYFGSSVKASFLALGADLTGAEVEDKVAVTQDNLVKATEATKAITTLQNYNK